MQFQYDYTNTFRDFTHIDSMAKTQRCSLRTDVQAIFPFNASLRHTTYWGNSEIIKHLNGRGNYTNHLLILIKKIPSTSSCD